MATPLQVRDLAIRLGADLVRTSQGRYGVMTADTPHGMCWEASGTHCLRAEWIEGDPMDKAEAKAAVLREARAAQAVKDGTLTRDEGDALCVACNAIYHVLQRGDSR